MSDENYEASDEYIADATAGISQMQRAQMTQQAAAADLRATVKADKAAFDAQGTGLPYVSKGDKEYAAKTQANVARAQWNDYKARFAPYEDKLAALIGNDGNTDLALSEANVISQNSTANAKAGLGMNRAKYGTATDAATQASSDRALGLKGAAANAGLRNSVRTSAYDRDINLMTGAGNAVSGIKQQEAPL